jgi:hypothetical protein
MPTVNITVADVSTSDPKQGCRWAVSRDGQEIEFGVAADENAAYEAAKPLFDRLRSEMARPARREIS